jgi:hypothetical protein
MCVFFGKNKEKKHDQAAHERRDILMNLHKSKAG